MVPKIRANCTIRPTSALQSCTTHAWRHRRLEFPCASGRERCRDRCRGPPPPRPGCAYSLTTRRMCSLSISSTVNLPPSRISRLSSGSRVRKIGRVDDLATAKNHGPLDDVAQLAQIAGPTAHTAASRSACLSAKSRARSCPNGWRSVTARWLRAIFPDPPCSSRNMREAGAAK